MNDIYSLNCPKCGGKLQVTSYTRVVECPYCGTEQVLPKLHNQHSPSQEFGVVCPVCHRGDRLEKLSLAWERENDKDEKSERSQWMKQPIDFRLAIEIHEKYKPSLSQGRSIAEYERDLKEWEKDREANEVVSQRQRLARQIWADTYYCGRDDVVVSAWNGRYAPINQIDKFIDQALPEEHKIESIRTKYGKKDTAQQASRTQEASKVAPQIKTQSTPPRRITLLDVFVFLFLLIPVMMWAIFGVGSLYLVFFVAFLVLVGFIALAYILFRDF